MARTFTYSFEDTTVTVSHPQFGTYSAYGTGIGSISVEYANDVSHHDVAADCSVVVSRTPIKNGTATFDILQSSDFHAWLKKWATFLENSEASNFADTTITIANKSTKDNFVLTGCTHQKIPTTPFGSTAGTVSWTIMAANISNQ